MTEGRSPDEAQALYRREDHCDPEEARGRASVLALSRRYAVAENTIYRLKAKFGGMEVSDARRLRELEQENGKLKHLLAEAELEKAALKELVKVKW